MREKYDLNQMLKEIEQDEKNVQDGRQKVSQNDIQKMLMQRKKKKEKAAS